MFVVRATKNRVFATNLPGTETDSRTAATAKTAEIGPVRNGDGILDCERKKEKKKVTRRKLIAITFIKYRRHFLAGEHSDEPFAGPGICRAIRITAFGPTRPATGDPRPAV